MPAPTSTTKSNINAEGFTAGSEGFSGTFSANGATFTEINRVADVSARMVSVGGTALTITPKPTTHLNHVRRFALEKMRCQKFEPSLSPSLNCLFVGQVFG